MWSVCIGPGQLGICLYGRGARQICQNKWNMTLADSYGFQANKGCYIAYKWHFKDLINHVLQMLTSVLGGKKLGCVPQENCHTTLSYCLLLFIYINTHLFPPTPQMAAYHRAGSVPSFLPVKRKVFMPLCARLLDTFRYCIYLLLMKELLGFCKSWISQRVWSRPTLYGKCLEITFVMIWHYK